MKYDFNAVINRRNTNCTKYDCVKLLHPDVPEGYIPMWVADMDFACPPEVIQALRTRLEHPILGYTNLMSDSYRSALDRWMLKRHNWDSSGQRLVLSFGVLHAILHCIELLTEPGDKVVLQTPIYSPFLTQIKNANRTEILNPLICRDGYYTIDYEDLEEKAKDPRVKMLLFCSPHNPTGRVWKEEELRRVADICLKNDMWIVVDEVHHDLVRMNQKAVSLASLYPGCERIITCTSPSKTFNLAGNISANLFVPTEELEQKYYERFQDPVPCLATVATEAAYTLCEQWVDELRQYLDQNFSFMEMFLKDNLPEAKMQIPEGTYLAWVDFSGLGLSDDEIKSRIIQKAGVIIEAGNEFVANGDGYMRFNLACPRSVLEEALQRVAQVLKEE